MDTSAKTIKLESNEQLGSLIETLEKLLPKGLWKEFTLETHTTIYNWSSPIVIKEYVPRPWWDRPYWSLNNNQLLTNVTNADYQLKKGVFNLEC